MICRYRLSCTDITMSLNTGFEEYTNIIRNQTCCYRFNYYMVFEQGVMACLLCSHESDIKLQNDIIFYYSDEEEIYVLRMFYIFVVILIYSQGQTFCIFLIFILCGIG